VFVRNRGLTSTGMMALMTDADFPIVANGCEGLLAPGEECAMQLAFSPLVAGPREGRLTVTAASGASASLGLRGVGLALLEIVRVVGEDEELVGAWDFGTWPANRTGGPRERFLLRARASMGRVEAGIDAEVPYAFTKGETIPLGGGAKPGRDECQGEALEGHSTFFGATCPIEIVFGPERTGRLRGSLVISTASGESLTLPLLGTGS
jgi:hypothetical protein